MKLRSKFVFLNVFLPAFIFAAELPIKSSFLGHCYYGLKRRWAFRQVNAVEAAGNPAKRIEYQIRYMAEQPVRDLNKDAKSREFLKEHKFYISLTTSPKRISNLKNTLATLDLTHVEKIYVSLPEKFGRDGSEYVIPDFLKNHPKVEIIRTPKDYGPATKIIPAAEKLQGEDKNAYLLSIDDDTAYARGMVNDYIYACAHMPGAAIGRSGVDVNAWKLSEKPLAKSPYRDASSEMKGVDSAVAVDVLEGFAGVAYPVSAIDTQIIKEWGARCPECYLADDLVISLSLARARIPRIRYVSDYNRVVMAFDYAYEGDALHKGAGIERNEEPASSSYNVSNYLKTFAVLKDDLEDSRLIQRD